MQQAPEGKSIGELFSDLSRETTELIRQEMRLATTELTRKAKHAGREVMWLALGAAIAYAGFLVLLAAAVAAVAIFLPAWVAALVVGLVVAVIGGVLVQQGISALKNVDLAPRQTIETLKEDKEWAKAQV